MHDRENQQMIENIRLIRNIFYRCFAIGLLTFILIILLYHFEKTWVISLVASFTETSKQEVNLLLVYFIGWTRMFILYVFLIPALALHWTGHELKQKIK
jgi:hypothetical protein